MTFPKHPFWDYSVRLYRKPGVADACLYVQDGYGLNVNLVLLCIWLADDGNRALDAEQIAGALRRISDWETRVIQPLREMRRASRREPLGIPEYLLQAWRPRIETAELEAERVEQLVLAEFARTPPPAAGAALPAAAATSSLLAYLEELGIERDARLDECLGAILGAAFTGARFPSESAGP